MDWVAGPVASEAVPSAWLNARTLFHSQEEIASWRDRRIVPVMFEALRFLFVLLLVAYGGLALFAFIFTDRMLFPVPPASYGPSPEIVHIPTGDGAQSVAVIYLPHAESSRLLLYSHGNFEDLGHVRPRMELFQALGFAVLAWDYPGYGLSDGRPTEQSVNAAIDAVFAHALEVYGHRPEDTVVHGFSVGAGPALHLAAQHSLAGVIVESAFTSTFDLIAPFRFLPWDVFDNAARIQEIAAPVLIIHGTEDSIVPFRHAQRLLVLAPQPRSFFWVETAGHNDLIQTAGGAYIDAIYDFLSNPLHSSPAKTSSTQ